MKANCMYSTNKYGTHIGMMVYAKSKKQVQQRLETWNKAFMMSITPGNKNDKQID